MGRSNKKKLIIHYKKISFFDLFSFLTYPHLSYLFLVIFCIMGKYISLLEKNRSKPSTQTLKRTVLSSSDAHASSASNSTGTSILSQLDNKDITTDQNRNKTSKTDDIHSCLTPRKKLQCSGRIYNHSFGTNKYYTNYCTC